MKTYQVLKKFDSKKDYEFDIHPQYAKCLEVMKKGDKTTSKDFVKHTKTNLLKEEPFETILAMIL